jgi:hypothetical protein
MERDGRRSEHVDRAVDVLDGPHGGSRRTGLGVCVPRGKPSDGEHAERGARGGTRISRIREVGRAPHQEIQRSHQRAMSLPSGLGLEAPRWCRDPSGLMPRSSAPDVAFTSGVLRERSGLARTIVEPKRGRIRPRSPEILDTNLSQNPVGVPFQVQSGKVEEVEK